jgi:predicted alpha/beta superfamily hydrolase
VRTEALTGRVFLIVAKKGDKEPRVQGGVYFGADVEQLQPEQPVIVDNTTRGFPVKRLSELPAGQYFVQAVANVYTQFHRSDGHTIWAHMDQWEGQRFRASSGNLVSDVKRVTIGSQSPQTVQLELVRALPPRDVPPDTPWVKRVKIQSKLVSAFWGHPTYFGATVLLPKGYAEHPSTRYPVIYLQGHFSLKAPLNFDPNAERGKPCKPVEVREHRHVNVADPGDDCDDTGPELIMPESRAEFYQEWNSDNFPRFIIVTFQHPTPYYDDSYAVNSANTGPYGDAVMQELIPYVEEHFRIIRKPYARMLTGASTGGWEALALQIYHPEFFGGSWAFAPDPVDFRRYEQVNIYEDENAFFVPGSRFEGINIIRYSERLPAGDEPILSVRDESWQNAVLGSKNRSTGDFDNWEAVWGPVAEDGYPRPLWDKLTGKIDHSVAEYMKSHGYDLRAYLSDNWPVIGPKLVGKLHVICGDMDNYYLNLSSYLFQDYLESTANPYYAGSFEFGRPMKGHGWQSMTMAELIRIMAKEIASHAPPGEDTQMWNY